MNAKKYRINEIFYSIQAEGRNAGKPAIFVRFSGCNLDCPFCDTNHEPFREMTREEIENEALSLVDADDKPIIVFTGGEPTLQLTDDEEFFKGYYRAMESNGILKAPEWIDWVTISPKTELPYDFMRDTKTNELKLLYGWYKEENVLLYGKIAELFGVPCYMQPTADKNGKFDIEPAVEFCKKHPQWTLSLQWHKLFNVR